MFKKILAILFCVVVTSIFGAYFFFVSKLEAKQKPSLICDNIEIVIQDNLDKNFISVPEIRAMVEDSVLGKALLDINCDGLEKQLSGTSVINQAQAYIIYPDKLVISVNQREPVVRFVDNHNSFYCDANGFVLPLTVKRALNLPIITGEFPIVIDPEFRGNYSDNSWLMEMISLSEKIRNNAYWSNEIEQIDVLSDGDIVLYPRKRPFTIQFGDASGADSKLEKLAIFYKTILPTEEGSKYTKVNLQYKNQIICK